MYEQFYGLTGRPFQLTPDPDFYYESKSHKKALSYLGYGLAQGEGFIIITGEVGAGKSTLVAHLMEKVDPEQLTVGKIVTSALDGEELIHVVAQCFGLEVEGRDKASALGMIEMFLADEAREGRRCLLVVDESQNLDIEAIEELRMLSNFQLGSHPLLQTLLLGQPEFRRLVANHPELEQLRQRVIASHHLDALQPGELKAYVSHRLEHVGWTGNPAIGPDVFSALFKATGGIPRKINQIMNRMLLLGAIEEHETFTVVMMDEVCAEMVGDANHGAANANAVTAPARVSQPKAKPVAEKPPVRKAPAAKPKAKKRRPVEASREEPLGAQVAELKAAVAKVNPATSNASAHQLNEISESLAKVEKRLDDQEQSVRHVLTLLVEWFEEETDREAA
jgi:putative secretion ATPase (PEP-CTERM system associated)